MIKMIWDTDMESMDDEHKTAMRDAVAESGDTRVILCRCDDERAIKFGHGINITMFQGRHVEHLMSERTKK